MLIAIPSDHPGGLDSAISDHFGHCSAFTVVNVENGEIGEVSILENQGHEQGGCLAPVQFLKGHGVEILLAGGMGPRPLAGFQQVGIAVHFKESAESVREAVDLFVAGGCPKFGEAQTCGGEGGECGEHHHEHVQRDPIEGVADIRDGRIITLEYELTDSDGNVLDSSAGHGPMRYLHGAGQLPPALESAIAGVEMGSSKTVELPCADAFGERDEARVLEVARDQLPAEVAVGQQVSGRSQGGQPISLTILHLDDTTARLDANHPFAGKDVVFNVKVAGVENATAEEIAHSHTH
jgi:FKBP-type peptidyl-prolyl cis-trans isomerase 2